MCAEFVRKPILRYNDNNDNVGVRRRTNEYCLRFCSIIMFLCYDIIHNQVSHMIIVY